MSVIVPAYNSQDTIEKCLRAIKKSTYRDYEVVVVNCGNQNEISSIANKYADKVIKQQGIERSHTRTTGIKAASGEIIVNIDSDVIIKPDTLTKIDDYFSHHPGVDALTGLLSKEHPNPDFFSQYKNLYMHYIFRKLPEKVTFLYGSIYAIRDETAHIYASDIKIADDTALGQKLVSCGKKIAFLRDLEVIHLKKYTLLSFVKNDFQIPFDWAKIFLKYKGWKQLGRNKTGYAHSPKEQLISVVLAPAIFLVLLGTLFGYASIPVLLFSILAWLVLNFHFLAFLMTERGPIFGISAVFITFIDNMVMAMGILCGFATTFMWGLKKMVKLSFDTP